MLIFLILFYVHSIMDNVAGSAGNPIQFFDDGELCKQSKKNKTITEDVKWERYRGCHRVINPTAPNPLDRDHFYSLECISYGLAKLSYRCEEGCKDCGQKDLEVGRCRDWEGPEVTGIAEFTKVGGCLYYYNAIGVWGWWFGFLNLSYLVFCGLVFYCGICCILGCVWVCCLTRGLADSDMEYAEF